MKTSSGFTLLEILVAISIFAIIGVASSALLASVIDRNELSDQRFQQLEKLQRAMIVMERDLHQAIKRPIRVEGELNENVMVGGVASGSDADGIGFVRAGWHNPQFMLPRSNMQYVAYRLQDNQLERLYGNHVDNVIGFEPKVRVLLKDVDDFQVEFFVKSEGAPEDDRDWNESFQGTVLPRAVAIIVTTKAFGEIRREFMLSGGET